VADDWRRSSKFGRFVLDFGTKELAAELGINEAAVYHWIAGRTSPDPVNAIRLQELAGERRIRLSLGDIYELRSAEYSKRGIPSRLTRD
jgi:hypothetical protein